MEHVVRRPVLEVALVLAISVLAHAACAQTATCPDDMASKADDLTGTLQSWAQFAAYRVRYQACDDGGIAEGISEADVRLLSARWDTLPALEAEIRRDPKLLPFVLRHIDATVDGRDIDAVIRQSARECPPGAAPLCRKIHAAASRAREDMRRPAD